MKIIGLSLAVGGILGQRQAIQSEWPLHCYAPVGLSSDITLDYDHRSNSGLDPDFKGWQAPPGS